MKIRSSLRAKGLTAMVLFLFCPFVLSTFAQASPVDDCIFDLGTHIKREGLAVSRSAYRSAMEVCRRSGGDLTQALSVLGRLGPKREPPPALRPRIVSFRVSPSRVRAGQFVSFHWQVEGADTVTLSDDVGVLEQSREMTARGATSITVSRTTTYHLLARNRHGQRDSRSFTVRVRPKRVPPRGPRPPLRDCCPVGSGVDPAKCDC